MEYAKDQGIQAKDGELFKSIVGKGVQATIDGEVHYAGNLKLFEEMDFNLENIQTKVDDLQRQGKTVVIIGTKKRNHGYYFRC